MRFVRYRQADATRYGIVEGERIAEIDAAPFETYRRTGRGSGCSVTTRGTSII